MTCRCPRKEFRCLGTFGKIPTLSRIGRTLPIRSIISFMLNTFQPLFEVALLRSRKSTVNLNLWFKYKMYVRSCSSQRCQSQCTNVGHVWQMASLCVWVFTLSCVMPMSWTMCVTGVLPVSIFRTNVATWCLRGNDKIDRMPIPKVRVTLRDSQTTVRCLERSAPEVLGKQRGKTKRPSWNHLVR